MYDIILNTKGEFKNDLEITPEGDIVLEDSPRQNVLVVLRWIEEEWRFDPDLGFPWYEDVWVKTPSMALIRQEIISAVLDVEGVDDADVEVLEYSAARRTAKFGLHFTVGTQEYDEEVDLDG